MKLNTFFSLAAALVCASSLSAATLQSLVSEGTADGAIIIVPAGTYEPSDLTDETRTLTFKADGEVILDGSHNARCADLSDTITLDGFVIQNGLAECGGGVRGGTVINSVIQNCSADFGGGTYKTDVRTSILKGNTAEFFGMAAYGGTLMSCRVEGNASATYGGGLGALFGVKVANTAVTGNTATRDFAGALASNAQNMIFCNNTATKGLYEGAPMKGLDLYGGSTPEDYKAVSNDATLFADAENGNYDLDLTEATQAKLKDLGEPTLGGYYDELWYNTDLAGRPRFLGTQIDIGPYEIPETFNVTCEVEGVGSVSFTPTSVPEGDTVTFTATKVATKNRDFEGFYVNGELVSTEMTMTYAPVKTDKIVARFKGLSATPDTLTNVLTQLHDTICEVVTLADGTYTIPTLTKPVVFMGTSIGGTIVSAAGDQLKSVFVNVTIKGTPANATIHRSLITGGCSGATLTITSSVITSDCTNLSGTAVNVTAYNAMPSGLACTDCLTLSGTADTIAGAILAKDSESIDAGANNSGIIPYDNYDIAGRPRVMGEAIDKGAHECHYISLTVQAEGYYTALDPEVGTKDALAGDKLTLTATSPREFKGWTLEDGTAVESPYTLPEEDVTLTATFAGFEMTPDSTLPEGTTAQDIITLAAGTYNQTFDTSAKIVGTGVQGEVTLSGTVTGDAVVEAVTLTGKLGNVTLNRCRVNGATMVDDTVAVTATNSIFIGGSVKGTFTNNTFDGTTVVDGSTQTNSLVKADGLFTEDYQLAETATDAIDKGTTVSVGALDYYGNPRINNGTIDKGAAEYQWPPYVVTINVIGHGLVSHRGEVDVIRGETLTFTAKEDPDHTRGGAPEVTSDAALTDNGNGSYTVTPTGAVTITVTFDPITVGPSDKDFTDLAAAVAEAQDGDTIHVDPGTYGAIDVKGKAIKIVATSSYATNTIIDAQGLTRAVNLADGAEIIGFTIQGGIASEGAGVNGGTVRRCIIKDNKLTYNGTGAGICNVDLAESCLIYNNGSADVARSNGGGAANSFLLNCTVAQNTASSGAGLYDCTAKNCVVALNTDLSGAAADWYGESIEIDPSDCCTPIEGSHEVIDATTIFVSPETNDWRLRAGVPCIDAGEADDRLSDKDIAGVNRVYNNTVDMGALEWNSPDYEITIDFQGRGQVAATYGSTTKTITAKETIKVPRTTTSMTFTWTSFGEVERSFKGIFIDGESVSTTATTEWTITAANSVHATLVFTANDLEATTDDATDVLADAIAGEVINLAAGTYEDQLVIGEDVMVIGAATDTVILAGGATLADGASLTKVSATAPIVGPEEGSAELSYAKVYDVTAATAVQNLIVKTVLIRDSLNGVAKSIVYLSTIVNNTGVGATDSKVYGSVLWNNGIDAENSTCTDSYTGDAPAFTSYEEDNYTLTGRSPLIDLAGTPAWEGFDAADFATDLDGNARPSLFAYDAGAYEYQAPADAAMSEYWTWYGSSYDVNGNIGDAAWTRMQYGAPQTISDGDKIILTDRTGFLTATVGVDKSSYVSETYFNASRVLNLVNAGGLLMTDSVMNYSSGTLNLAAPMMIGGQFVSSTGKINILDGAGMMVGGLWENKGGIPVTISGGSISTEQSSFIGADTTLIQTGGEYNFGSVLSLRDTATATFAGGTVTGGRISVAQGNRTAIYFTGANVTVERLETGDTSGARYGNIEQTGGTVKLIGTATEKNAPLHISHWPGESHYYLKGGELIVPNSEVRLGRDGNGRLHIEGGVAKLRAVVITNGTVYMKGGTYHALETQTLAANQTASSTYEVADGKVLTLNLTTTDGTGTTTKLASGSFKTTVPNNVNLTLGKNVALEGNVALGAYTLTLPGNGAATLTGDYTVGSSTITIDPETAPALSTKTAVLTVSGTIDGTPTLVESQQAYYTLEVADGTIYVTLNTALPEETTVTTPTLTVDGDTTWTGGNWSSDFVANGDAIVKVVSSGKVTFPETKVNMGTVTFDVPEGKTLTIAWPYTGSNYPNATTIVKTGLGTLRLETLFNYTNFTEGEGILEMAAAGQTFAGAAIGKMALIADANVKIQGATALNLTIADGKTVTLTNPVACTGTIIGEGSATIAVETTAMTFTGTVDVAGTLTCSGATLTLAGDVAVGAIEGAYALGTLNSLDLGSGSLELNTTLANCFEKSGAGSVTLTSETVYSGSLTLGGPVTITEAEAIRGALHFKEGATITMPYNCTWTSTGEIRVEPTVTFVLTGTPETGTYTLLKSQTTVGLQTDNLSSLSIIWAEAPESLMIPKLALQDSALVYTVTAPTALVWTGATDTDWSGTGNWNGNTFADGNAVAFNETSAGENTSVELSKMVAPSVISIESGTFTIDGGENGYGFDGNVTVTQAADSTMTWSSTFLKEGSYTIYNGATANVSVDSNWAYNGHFIGDGRVVVNAGVSSILDLNASSAGFTGTYAIDSGASLRLNHEEAAYNAIVEVAGSLKVIAPATVRAVTMAAENASITVGVNWPLTVRESLTGYNGGVVKVAISNMPEVAGDWEIMYLPEGCDATFELAGGEVEGYTTFLSPAFNKLYLSIRPDSDIAWGLNVNGEYGWVINGTRQIPASTEGKNIYLNDLELETVSTAVPATPVTITVNSTTTKYTLTGTTAIAPETITLPSETTLTLAVSTTPGAIANDGTLTISGNGVILDLTNAKLSGHGMYVAGTGATILVSAQTLAETTAVFNRAGGTIQVVVDADTTLPDGNYPTGGDGTLIKSGDGTLYITPNALANSMNIQGGSVVMTGATAIKARYLKFEPHARFAASSGSKPPTGIGDIVTTMNGKRQDWPEGTKIVRFDSGVTNSVQIGVTGDDQEYIATNSTGEIGNLFDNNPATQFLWREWHAEYGLGGSYYRRNYFIIDAGEAGIEFTGYNIATPATLSAFFYKWDVSVANDISNWRPGTEVCGDLSNEDTVWQDIDVRENSNSYSSLSASSWMSIGGYTARKYSGLYSNLPGAITIAEGAELNLEKLAGTTGILPDVAVLSSVTGEGTLTIPSSLTLDAKTITVGTLQLAGSAPLKNPIPAETEISFTTLALTDAYAQALLDSGSTEFLVVKGYDGDTETLPKVSSTLTLEEGKTWATAIVNNDLYLYLVSSSDVYVTVSADTAWSGIAWQNAAGGDIEEDIDWTTVKSITIRVNGTATLSGIPAINATDMPALTAFNVDFGYITTKPTLTLAGTNAIVLPTLAVKGQTGGVVKSTLSSLSITTLAGDAPYNGVGVEVMNALTASSYAYTGSGVLALYGTDAGAVINKRVTVPAARPLEIAGGTVKLSQEENFGSMVCVVQVNADATLDVNGCAISNNIILAGGTLTNTGAEIPVNKRQTYNITLTADSTVSGTGNFMSLNSGYAWHSMNLNGHTLTKTGTNTFAICNATIVGGGGTILAKEGTVRFFQYTKNPTTNFQNVTLKEYRENEESDYTGNILIEKDHPIVGTLTLDGTFEIGKVLAVSDQGDGSLVVAGGDVSFSTAPTYTGTTTVKSGAAFGAPSVAGDLTFEEGAVFKPISGTAAMTVGGTLTSDGTIVNLSSAKDSGAKIPLITTGSGQTLTTDMVEELANYTTSVDNGTIYYTYVGMTGAYYWNGGASGNWEDYTWLLNKEGNNGRLPGSAKVTFFAEDAGTITLTRESIQFTMMSISPVKAVTIPAEVTLNVPEPARVDYALTMESVTLMAETSKLVMGEYFATTVGNVTGSNGTFSAAASLLDTVGTVDVGTLEISGSKLPTTGPDSLVCSKVKLSDEVLALIRSSTNATTSSFVLAQATTMTTMPSIVTEAGVEVTDYVVVKNADDNKLYITVAGDPSVTSVKATVSSASAKWSELTWYDTATNEAVTPVWPVISSVTLEATAGASVSLNVDVPNLASLTVTGEHTVELTSAGSRLAGAFGTLTLLIDDATLCTQDVTAAATNVMAFSSTTGTWQIANTAVTEITGSVTIGDTVTLKTAGALTLSSTGNTLNAAAIEVVSGTLNLTADSGTIAGNLTIASGATLNAMSDNALIASTENTPPMLIVNGTLNLDGVSWALSGWTVQMGAGATIAGSGATVDGQTLALNFTANSILYVAGANATLSAPIGATTNDKTLQVYMAAFDSSTYQPTSGTSLNWTGDTSSTIFNVELLNAPVAMGSLDYPATVTMTGEKAATGLLTVGAANTLAATGTWAGSVTFAENSALTVGNSVFHVNGVVTASGLTVNLPADYAAGDTVLTSNNALAGSMLAVATVNDTAMSGRATSSTTDGVTTYVLTYAAGVVDTIATTVTENISAWSAASWTNMNATSLDDMIIAYENIPHDEVTSVTVNIDEDVTLTVAESLAEIFPKAEIILAIYSGATYALTVEEGATEKTTALITGNGTIKKLGEGTLDLTGATMNNFTGSLNATEGTILLAQGKEVSVTGADIANGATIAIKLSEIAVYTAGSGLNSVTVTFLTPDGVAVAPECVANNTFTPLNLVRDDVTYVNIFRGTTDETDTVTKAETATAWYKSTDNASWTVYSETLAPLLSNSSHLTTPALFDGNYMPTIAADAETGRKVVEFSTGNATTVEGWAPNFSVCNNVDLTINKLVKLQSTSYIRVDETSKLTMAWNGNTAGNGNGTPTFYIKGEEGLTFTKTYNIAGASTYYLYEAGSVKYATTVQGTHTIAGFTLDLGEGAYTSKATTKRQLVSFTSSSATFGCNADAATAMDSTEMTKVDSLAAVQALGDYFVQTETDGVYVYYLTRSDEPPYFTWTGASGTDTNWTTGANWSTGTAPTSTDDVIIPYGSTVTVDRDVTVNSVRFSVAEGSAPATLTGTGILTTATTTVEADTDVSAINPALGAVTVAADTTFALNAATFAAATSITRTNATTSVIEIKGTETITSLPAHATSFPSNIFQTAGAFVLDQPLNYNGTIDFGGTSGTAITHTVILANDITATRMVLGNVKNTNTTVYQTGGTITLTSTETSCSEAPNNAMNIGHWNSTVNYHLKAGALLVENGAISVGWDGNGHLHIGQRLVDAGETTAYVSTKKLGSTSRNNTSSLTINPSGTLKVGSDGISLPSNKSFTLDGGTLMTDVTMDVTLNHTNGLAVSADSTITVGAGATMTYDQVLSGAGKLTKTGAGMLDLTGITATNYNGSLAVTEGYLEIDAAVTNSVTVAAATGTLYVVLTNDEEGQTFNNITLADGVNVENVRFVTTSGKIVKATGASGEVVYIPASMTSYLWQETADSTWENKANWTIGGEAVDSLPGENDSVILGSGTDATTLTVAENYTVADITIGAPLTINNGTSAGSITTGAIGFGQATTLNTTLTLVNENPTAVAVDATNLTVTSGTLKTQGNFTITGGTYTGTVIVDTGTLSLTVAEQQKLSGTLTICKDATFVNNKTGDNNSADALSYQSATTLNVYGKLDMGSTRWTTGNATMNVYAGAEITGAGQGSNGAFDWHAASTVNFKAAEGEDTVVLANALSLRNKVITFNVEDGVTVTASGIINEREGSGTLTKTGAGNLVLANATNTYSGPTNVNAGTLTVTGATGTGLTTVADGATICGTGTVKGALTFADGATLLVDPAAEPLTVSGATVSGKAKLDYTGVSFSAIPLLKTTTAALTNANFDYDADLHAVSVQVTDGVSTAYIVPRYTYSTVYGTIGGNTTWDSIAWTSDAEGTTIIAPVWNEVTTVVLTATADAEVTLDADVPQLASLSLTGAHAITLASSLADYAFADNTGYATVQIDAGATLKLVDAFAATTGLMVDELTEGNGGTLTLANVRNTEITSYVAVAEGVDVVTETTMTMSSIYNSFAESLTVSAGTLTFTGAVGSATSVLYDAELITNTALSGTVTVAGTLDINGIAHPEATVSLWGGTIKNSGAGLSENGTPCLPDVTLFGNSTIDCANNICLVKTGWATHTLNLGTSTLTKTGAGKLVTGNLSITTGTLKIEEGAVNLRGSMASTLTGVTFDIADGAELKIESDANYALVDTVTVKGDVTFANAFSGEGSLAIASGTTLLNGTNTYTGATTVAADATIGGTGSITSPLVVSEEGASITIVDPATPLKAQGGFTTLVTLPVVIPDDVTADSIQVLQSSTMLSTSMITADSVFEPAVTEVTEGDVTTYTLVLEKNDIYSGTLYASPDGSLWTALAWTDANGTAVENIDWAYVKSVQLTINGEGIPVMVDADISRLQNLTVVGTGSALITPPSDLHVENLGTYAGSPAGSGTLSVSSGMSAYVSGIYAEDATLTLTGVTANDTTTVGSVTFGSPVNAVVMEDNIALSTATTMTIPGVISGAGSLAVIENSTLTLTAANTYTGNTTIAEGSKLIVNSGTAKVWSESKTTKIIVNGELEYQSTDLVYRGLTGAGKVTIAGNVGIPNTGDSGNNAWDCGLSAFTGSIVVNEDCALDLYNWGQPYDITLTNLTVNAGATVKKSNGNGVATVTVNNLAGSGTIESSVNVTFASGATLTVADVENPIAINGTIAYPEGGIAVVLPEGDLPETIPLVTSTTALTADLLAVNTAYARNLTSSTVEGVTTYTLSYVKKNFYEEGLYTTVTTDNYWSLATWSDKNGIVYAAGEIDWTQVQKVYLTVNTTAESTLFSSYDLTSLTTVTVTGSGPLTIANWMAQIGSGTLAVGGGVTLTLVDLYAADAAVTMTGVVTTEAVGIAVDETVTAGTVNFENNSVTNVTAAITLQDGLALSASTDMTFAGGITGDGSLTVALGTTTLTAANTYTGDTTIASGAKLIVNTGSAETWDEVSTAKIIVDGELEYQSTGLAYRGITGSGKVTINGNVGIPNTGNAWDCGLSDFTGSVVVNENCTLDLYNWQNAYAIDLATLTVNSGATVTKLHGNGAVTVMVDNLTGTGVIENSVNVTFAEGATLTVADVATPLTINGTITAPEGGITVVLPEEVSATTIPLIKSTAELTTAIVQVKEGYFTEVSSETVDTTTVYTLAYTEPPAYYTDGLYATVDANSDGWWSNLTWTSDAEGTVEVEDIDWAYVQKVYLTVDGQFSDFYVNADLSGLKSMTVTGSGNIALALWTGGWGYDAGTAASSGTLAIAENVTVTISTGYAADADLTITGVTVGETTTSGTVAFLADHTGTITLNDAVTLNSATDITISGVISGTGAVSVSQGTLTLTAANTYSGGTTVASGAKLVVNGAEASTQVLPTTKTVTNNGTVELVQGHSVTVTIEGEGTTLVSGTYLFEYPGETNVTNGINTSLTVNADATLQLKPWGKANNKVITNTVKNLTVNGTIEQNGGNVYSCGFAVSGTLSGTGTIASPFFVTLAEGATLDATAGTLTVGGAVTQTSALTVVTTADAGTTLLTGGTGSTYAPAAITVSERSDVVAVVDGTNLVLAAVVCTANDKGYASIADALAAVGATGGEIIVTADSLTLEETVVIAVNANATITLDLNGKTVTSTAVPAVRVQSGTLALESATEATILAYADLAVLVGEDAEGAATIGAKLVIGENVNVSGLVIAEQYVDTVSVTAGTIGGTGTISGNLILASGATLDATAGTLTVAGAVTSTSTAITATDYGPVLTAAGVDASTFTTTLDGAIVAADDTQLFLIKRPSLVVDETETISETAAAIIAEAAAAEGFYEVEMDADSKPADGLELFTNVDLELTVDEVDETKGTVKVAYDFGIADVTVQKLTTATTNITAEGTYVVLTVKVDNAGHNAGYGDDTKLVISMNVNGTEVEPANVIVIDSTTTTGVMKLAIPYETLEAAELTNSETFTFTVRATNEAE